jgi:hypothetical protein
MEGLYTVAKRLYDDIESYRTARMTPNKEEGNSDGSVEQALEKIKKEMHQTPATVTLTGVDLHLRIIEEKAQLLTDLGIFKDVFRAVENIDEQLGTNYSDTLDNLTEWVV